MRILIFGVTGMLGHKLAQVLSPDAEIWGTIRDECAAIDRYGLLPKDRCLPGVDAVDAEAVRKALDKVRPEVVINAVGVVKQLPSSKDLIATLSINSIFPHRLAQFGSDFGYRLITISTDCVFDGLEGNYTESDRPNAVDLYGKSKELGEVRDGDSLTLRTSIIGRELTTSHSLVEWFLSNRGSRIKGFRKAIYSGFPTVVLAEIIRNVVFEHRGLSGLYHVSSEPISKFELLQLVNKYYNANVIIEPSDELYLDRSLNSDRFREETGFKPATWPEMVERMASDPTPYDEWR